MQIERAAQMLDKVGNMAFIGAGKMATAIASGLIRKGFPKDKIKAYDISEAAAAKFASATGATASPTMPEALKGSNVTILAVKPQFVATALTEARPHLGDSLLLSIVAGLKIKSIMDMSGCLRAVRVMPNTPALIGEGISCYAGAPNIAAADLKAAETILSAVGHCCHIHESQMDAATGLSGSGPAYVLEFILALAEGGVHAGLPRDTALKLAVQTVSGSAKMAMLSARHLSELRDEVVSPGGTTSRGILTLEKGAFSGIVSAAVIAAAERSAELSGSVK